MKLYSASLFYTHNGDLKMVPRRTAYNRRASEYKNQSVNGRRKWEGQSPIKKKRGNKEEILFRVCPAT